MSKFVTFTIGDDKWSINTAHIICVRNDSKGNAVIGFTPLREGELDNINTGLPFDEVLQLIND